MSEFVERFLSLPVGVRAVLFGGFLLLSWLLLARPLLKIFSIVIWLLKKIFLGLYMLLEIPISILHSKLGSVFAGLDQGLTRITEKICTFMDKCCEKMKKPKTTFGMQAFIAYLVVGAYLLIPVAANLTTNSFVFWQQSYIEKEISVIQLLGLSTNQDEEEEEDEEEPIIPSDAVVSFPGKLVSLSDITDFEQSRLKFKISITPFTSSLQYNDKIIPFSEGSCYNFIFNGEEAQLMRVLDSVYLFCEHGIWYLPMQNNTQLVFDKKGWHAKGDVAFHEYASSPNGLPMYAILFAYNTSPQVFFDTWYEIAYDRKIVVNDTTGKEFLTLSRLGEHVRLTTAMTVDLLQYPYEEIVFCYEDGAILKYSDMHEK